MANLHSQSDHDTAATNLDQLFSGLRILVVDDDVNELKSIEKMGAQCFYHVTTCTEASAALNLLKEKKDSFDVVISHVHMEGMDGYKFLQQVDQEFNVAVISMSADNSTNVVMEGARHGACHHLIKPVEEDNLRNIWEHVIRKNEQHKVGGVMEFEYNDTYKTGKDNEDDAERTSSVIDENEGVREKRSLSRERDDSPTPTKRPRFVWTPERHEKFVNVFVGLGDKAVPMKILKLMDIPDMTREHVASHLQKYRLHLKKQSAATQQQNVVPNVMTRGGHVSPQTHVEVCYPAANIRPRESPSIPLMEPSTKEPNHSHAQPPYAVPNYNSNVANNFPQPLMAVHGASGYRACSSWPSISNAVGSVGALNMMLRQRHHNQQLQMHDQIYLNSLNNQPPYLVGPPQPFENLQVGITPAHVTNYTFGRNSFIDHSTLSGVSIPPSVLGSRTDHNGDVRPFHGLPPLPDAPVPYVYDVGQLPVENHGHVYTTKEQPDFINHEKEAGHQLYKDIYPS